MATEQGHQDPCHCDMRLTAPEGSPWTAADIEWAQALEGVETAVVVGDVLHVTSHCEDADKGHKGVSQALAMHFEGVAVEWACIGDPNL